MNAITNFVTQAGDILSDASDKSSSNSEAQLFSLSRTGKKAVRFQGWCLVESAGHDGYCPIYYDLAAYRTTGGQVVIHLIARRERSNQPDVYHVEKFQSLDAAAAWLEGYKFANDVSIDLELEDKNTPLPWAVLRSVQLRQCLARVEADYHSLLTVIFSALELSDFIESPENIAQVNLQSAPNNQ